MTDLVYNGKNLTLRKTIFTKLLLKGLKYKL